MMTGGASITPTARKSIHSHSCCPFAYAEAMGRYGINQSNRKVEKANRSTGESREDTSNEQGTDEVDNNFSKHAHPISSSSFNQRQRDEYRRKSLVIDEFHTEDSNNLSKSVPTILPSYYSDDSKESTPERVEPHISDVSYDSTSHGKPYARSSSGVSRNTPNQHHSANSSQNAQKWQNTYTQGSPKSSSKMIIFIITIFVALSTIYITKFNTKNTANTVVYDESRFYSDIDRLGNKYNIDDNSVLQMQTGIATIFARRDTGSFMFVYKSDDDHFNSNTFNMFVNDVTATASKYLRNDSTPVHYTTVEGSQLDMSEHCDLISRFRNDLDRTGVMLVTQLEAVPSTLAMAFHYYCDEYNPLVKKSAIFFTLNLAKCDKTENKPTHAVIEKCLAQKWSTIPSHSIGPLLTRVVNVVIDVTAVF